MEDPFLLSLVIFVFAIAIFLLMIVVMGKQAILYQAQQREQVSDAVTNVSKISFPLCVASLKTLKHYELFTSHETARDAGALRIFDNWDAAVGFAQDHHMIFISHQATLPDHHLFLLHPPGST